MSGNPIESLPAQSIPTERPNAQTVPLSPSGDVCITPMPPADNSPEIIIHCADCREVMAGMAAESIDCIVTDPPYRLSAGGDRGGFMGAPKGASGAVFNYNDVKPADFFPEFYRLLKSGAHCYVMCNNLNLPTFLNAGIGAGFRFLKSLIWNKGNRIYGRFYMSCYEHILLFSKQGIDRDINDCATPDILEIPLKKQKDEDGYNVHDTEKPVELMEILIHNSTNIGETVFDPFAGIGSTLIACQHLKRHAIGCEIEPRYCDIIRRRLSEN